jgi:delta-1-pyrroline-5-carboxylate synthetase
MGLMSLYETMFNQFDITTSQVLLTAFDFTSPERRRNVQYVISQLLALGIVPLLNENDAVSANQGYQLFGNTFSDNDSLAALVSIELSAQLLILLTDVPGVYDRPPTEEGAQLIDVFKRDTSFVIGEKSTQGRGGMGAKVDAALRAVEAGVQAVVIAAGSEVGVINKIIGGEKAGTLFLLHQDDESTGTERTGNDTTTTTTTAGKSSAISNHSIEDLARDARYGSRCLQALTSAERCNILSLIANDIEVNAAAILSANAKDFAIAEKR